MWATLRDSRFSGSLCSLATKWLPCIGDGSSEQPVTSSWKTPISGGEGANCKVPVAASGVNRTRVFLRKYDVQNELYLSMNSPRPSRKQQGSSAFSSLRAPWNVSVSFARPLIFTYSGICLALILLGRLGFVRTTPATYSGLNQAERCSISEVCVQVGAGEAIYVELA